MNIVLTAEQVLHVGRAGIIDGTRPHGEFAAAFEDDRETGYFYAVDGAASEHCVHAAAHIYTVGSMVRSHERVSVKVGWSSDSAKVVLMVDDVPHAVFDFLARQGFCRTGFPSGPTHGGWAMIAWSDSVMERFA